MPVLRDVSLVVEGDETLNLQAYREGLACYTGLPAQHAKPADHVTKDLLRRLRCELRNPIYMPSVSQSTQICVERLAVLAAACGSHRGHLRHGQDGGAEAKHAEDEGPD